MFEILGCFTAAVAYRIRGGGWFTLHSTIAARGIWFFGLLAAYLLHAWPAPDYWYVLWLLPAVFLSMMIPHAYCQNMGRWTAPQKDWPSFFMPTLSLVTWSAMSMWKRTAYDFISMSAVGFFRGFVVFMPYLVLMSFGYHAHHFEINEIALHVGMAIAAITLLQPFGYLIGWLMPFTITRSLLARSGCWGEFFNGIAWGIAMACL